MRARSLAVLALVLGGCRTEVSRLDDVQRMAYAVKPGVVRVTSLATAEFVPDRRALERLRDALRERGVPASSSEVTVVETGAGGSGSGFLVHPDGFVVTSAHVIDPTRDPKRLEAQLKRNGAVATLSKLAELSSVRPLYASDEVRSLIDALAESGRLGAVSTIARVELSNGESHGYTLRDVSPRFADGGFDLALLKISRRNLPILRIADSDKVHLQEAVWAFGYPSVASTNDELIGGWLSRESDLESTVNPGSITSIKRTVANLTIFQSNVAIYPGNSGGPAVNRRGEVIGVSSWGHGEAEQIRFLLPANLVTTLLRRAKIRENQEGAFNIAYREALEAAAAGEWQRARESLKRADTLFPNSPDVLRFARDADDQVRALPFWRLHPAITAGTAAVLALFTGGVLVLAVRMRGSGVSVAVARDIYVVPESRRDHAGAIGTADSGGEPALGRLTILNGENAGDRFGLGGSGIRIGREAMLCEIVLENPKVSRLHAELVSIDGRVLLIDRNSSNGTYVNDRKIDRHFLKDGDIIYFGGRNAVAAAFHS